MQVATVSQADPSDMANLVSMADLVDAAKLACTADPSDMANLESMANLADAALPARAIRERACGAPGRQGCAPRSVVAPTPGEAS